VRQQFTGHERDSETGLDFMQARYYSSGQGRFTSVDIPLADQWESDPQSWNLYTYVRNNPLNLIDPLGSAAQDPKKKDCLDDGACFNPESGLYELPGEPTGGIPYVVNIIEFYDPFLEKVFINQLVAEVTFTEKRDALVDAAMNGIPGGKFAAFVFKSRRIIKFAELSRKIQKLKRGGTVYVDTVEEARELLEHMPELRPATFERMMPNPNKLTRDGFADPPGTFRGDLLNKTDPTAGIHPGVTNPDHRDFPHYNIKFHDGTKASIVITKLDSKVQDFK
jgi:RHS repeat-associated protein